MAYIREAGGNNVCWRTWFVLLGSIGISVAEWVIFRGLVCAVLAIVLTGLGLKFRKSIMEWGTEYRQRSTLMLFSYGIILFAAKHFGLGHHIQLVVIGIATVLMFNLNFWSISEAVVVEREQIQDDTTA